MTGAFEVVARLDHATSLQETSKLFEGLYRLDRQRRVRVRIRSELGQKSYPRVVRLSVSRGGSSREIAIDLADQRSLVHMPDLEAVDVYYKRSFSPENLAHLQHELSSKIRPFGLNNPTSSLAPVWPLLSARRASGVSLRQLATDARQLLALPSPSAFECEPGVAAQPTVLFQTRVWEPAGDPLTTAINEERVMLVAELRKAFGARFVGGIIPSDYARKHFPEALTTLECSMRAYARLLRGPLVAIYCRGLHDSVGFKMAEYLAASRAIVGNRPTAVLPRPLEEGTHYLGFGTPEECVAQCTRLLEDAELAQTMRRSNWDYYLDQVEPSALLINRIEEAFEPG